ncbi:hypothetical protein [Microbulbifer sp. Q7]|nr:hypothetical protein [Microbulbifer sp. Q7]
MSDTLILYVGIAVFTLMLIGIGLTVYGFHRAGSERVRPPRHSGRKRE